MGFFQQPFVKDVASGFFGNDYLRDYTHASKTFLPDAYAYAPKFKFLFHVYFDVNENSISAAKPPNVPEDHNYGLAVKKVELPKFSFDLHTMNQYNRKRIVQTKIKYDPINIVFHDTNSGLITKLWHAYYTYYYKDGIQPDPIGSKVSGGGGQDINSRTAYSPDLTMNEDWGYIGEPSKIVSGQSSLTKVPFFRAINVYGFNQHNFILYRLINPMISSFTHDTYAYSENGTMENTMSLQYETVQYYNGAVDGKSPSQIVEKFATDAHYDRKLSPIAAPGSNSSILGQGGLVDGAGGVLDALERGDYLGAIRQTGQLTKTFNNPQAIINAAKGDLTGAATSWVTGTPNRNINFNFPTANQVVNDANNALVKGVGKTTGYYPESYKGPK